ncbi:MAG: hypothetical protein AAF687_05405 [Pseudomonadota bacterium]
MRLSFVPFAMAAFALSACGSSTGDEAAGGDAGSEAAGPSADGWPAGFDVYPGATVANKTVANIQGRPGSTWTLQTDDTAEKIIAYYAKQAAGAGFDVGKINTEETASFFTAKRESDRGEILASANRAPGAEVTSLNLTIVARASE